MKETTLIFVLIIVFLVNVLVGAWFYKRAVNNLVIWKVGAVVIPIVFILSVVLAAISTTHLINQRIEKKETIQLEALLFKDSVKLYIEELNIKHPDIVLNQAVIESGNFSSKIFKENNNMFGFKQAYKRPNTQIGVNRGYAVYKDWQECVIDYALYQTYSAKNLSKEDYIKFLGRNYAEDPDYSKKIQ